MMPGTSVTPSTSGLPETPTTASTIGRATYRSGRRPSVLNLITHPPGGGGGSSDLQVPPTPGGSFGVGGGDPYNSGSMRQRGHARMRSAGTLTASYVTECDPRVSQSAYPTLRSSFATIDERSSAAMMAAPRLVSGSAPNPTMSPSTSLTSSASNTDSISSTPSTSPPLPDDRELVYAAAQEPYLDGPRELIPGVWLGAEDSLFHFDVWARGAERVAVVNVAQEIENPFDNAGTAGSSSSWNWPTSLKGKAKAALTNHSASAENSQPAIEYAHLRWSHGEGGLSELPAYATLDQVLNGEAPDYLGVGGDQWRFWEAVRWLEVRRRAGVPIIIHCQCGVSRSATLAVAYVMTLAATGIMPGLLGNMRTMQDAYDFVKDRSPWIGPNVS